MNYDLKKVSRFNLKVIFVISLLVTIQAFITTGLEYGLPTAIGTSLVFGLGVVIYFINSHIYIEGVVVSLLPVILGVTLSTLFGGMPKLFTMYLVSMCLSALYFNRKVLVYYTGVLFIILSTVFIISPVSLMGAEAATIGDFGDRMVQLTAGFIILYHLMKWGNQSVKRAEKQEEEANSLANKLQGMSEKLEGLTQSLSLNSQQLAAASQEGNANIESAHQFVDDISASIEEISANADKVASLAQKTNYETKAGSENIYQTIRDMNEINEQVIETAVIMKELDDYTKRIVQIIGLINEITDQTNLLALNASIEAARAGKHGDGFAVVAEEIRGLAEETSAATSDIENLVDKIRTKSAASLESITEVKDKSKEGQERAEKTEEIFGTIEENIADTSERIFQTSQATQNLTANSLEVQNMVAEIQGMSSEVANSSHNLADMVEQVHDLANEMNN